MPRFDRPQKKASPPSPSPGSQLRVDILTKPSVTDPVSSAAAAVERVAPSPDPDVIMHDEEKRRATAEAAKQERLKGARRPGVKTRSSLSRTTSDEQKDRETKTEQERLDREKAEFIAACRSSGEQLADSMILLKATMLGDEWLPDPPRTIQVAEGVTVTIDEAANIQKAYADTFQRYGWRAIPGWWTIPAAEIGYALHRLSRPKTQEKVKVVKEKALAFYHNWKAQRADDAQRRAETAEREKQRKAAEGATA